MTSSIFVDDDKVNESHMLEILTSLPFFHVEPATGEICEFFQKKKKYAANRHSFNANRSNNNGSRNYSSNRFNYIDDDGFEPVPGTSSHSGGSVSVSDLYFFA